MEQRYYSNVYWHFTGSPTDLSGHVLTKPADIHALGTLKTLDEATQVLLDILHTQKLRATSRESLSEDIHTDRFCCVTDIPLKDLPLHAINYGRVALGFRANVIHKQFAPVLYLSKDNLALKKKLIPNKAITQQAYEHFYSNSDWTQTHGYQIKRFSDAELTEPAQNLDPILHENPFLNFIKITDFGLKPEDTFYSEREWRFIGDFAFEVEDIEAVIAPAEKLPYLRQQIFNRLNYPETLSLFAWEFLENA
jgi:hypothetical protein